ncbi:hypothetical protein HG536_0G01720 [Torulaspora globosa]|uniref:Uncharacterized protein n=1 Tax=Torulaspora globosa TaxID=48254 RepID=A0A7G3ZLC7_9SACH|nr:uncharacterized protein HG536_0G01720 [Torulaspora globosa]QLL34313.1 hypothetical protein HG536_0G01720 [Torulaspora globosa]
MSHPPPSKKRYYYSNGGPNHMMRYGSSFPKKSYAGNGGYGMLPSGSTPAAIPAAASEIPRPSRYDPSSPSRPVSSRNPGSRYNPEVEVETQPFAGDPHMKPSGSRYSGSRYNQGQAQQARPRSMEMAKKDSSYGYPMAGGNGPANASLNTASGYYSRSNKWRSQSFSNLNMDHYDNYSGSAARPPFWKSQKSKFTTVPPSSQGPRRTTPSPTIASSGHFSRFNGSSSRRESGDESEVIPEINGLDARDENPHSLGSSLINSVAETTRKVEKEHAANLKRTSLDKSTFLPSKEPPKATEDEELEKTSPETAKEVSKPLKKTSEMWSSSGTSLNELKELVNEDSEKQRIEEEPIFHKEPSKIYDDYEFIYEPDLLKTDLKKLSPQEPKVGYSIPIKPLDKCIFPLSKAETRLWELKNQSREKVIEKQRYLLRQPIKAVSSYPFIQQNLLIHRQALRPLLCRKIASVKRYEYLRKLQLKKQFSDLQATWVENCEQIDEMSRKMRKEELERKRQEELEEKEREMNERKLSERNSGISGSSRRRNRADFVDDAEIENVLLQIDPDYKHHQQAADIPPMIINPVERYTLKLKNVNNLVTDKHLWASRILKDGVDTFTQNEHELFVEGYLTYPKKFGKISQFMGGLRSPEECVLHYYKSKNTVGYKKLLNDKNKKRQKGATAKRRKKKERSSEVDVEISTSNNEADTSVRNADINKETTVVTSPEDKNIVSMHEKPFKQMEQVVIKIPETQDMSNNMSAKVPRKEQRTVDEEAVKSQKDEQKLAEGNSNNMAHQKPYPLSPMPDKSDIDASGLKKRAHDGDGIFTNAEKTILDEQPPTDNNTDSANEQPPRVAESIEQPSDSQRSEISNDDNLQRKRHKSSADHKSSYWSVKEANLFPELLKQFGSQWSLISEKLGTKSTTMVRNYYQRNAAQLGWKSIVEEADFRRNATSSGSVQQSQILIQAEQNSLQTSNGIPPQQRPALGFFSNQAPSEKKLPDITTASQLYTHKSNRDSFSQALTPTSTLPPPRLPSIQLPGTVPAESTKIEPLNQPLQLSPSPTENLLCKQEKPAGAVSSIMSILNTDDKKQSYVPPLVLQSTNQVPHFGQLQHSQPTSAVRPSVGKVVVQDLQNSSSSSPENRRSSSISSLLNPEHQQLLRAQPQTTLPRRALDKGSLACPPPLAQPQQTNFNFAVDPLGALAAIASESLLPPQAPKPSGNQGNNT